MTGFCVETIEIVDTREANMPQSHFVATLFDHDKTVEDLDDTFFAGHANSS